jgi:hypothetical protein
MSGLSKLTLAGGLLASLLLAGCGDVRETLGLNKEAPDEFAVVSRAPLSVPPDAELRPPRPGESLETGSTSTPEEARRAVFGLDDEEQRTLTYGGSAGERALLRRAGAEQSDPAIRSTINEETSAMIEADEGLVEELMFWREGREPLEEELLDAGTESERLQRRQALGLPPEEDEVAREDTEAAETEEEGFFGRLF